MPRKAREKSPSGIYHIVICGHGRKDIFLCTEDKEKFISLLVEYQDLCGFKLYAYCLANNHMHLLINECDSTISRIITRIGTSYVCSFNNKYGTTGGLFSDRFKSQVVEKEQDFIAVMRYIHNHCQEMENEQVITSYENYFSSQLISSDMARRILGGKVEFEYFHNQPCTQKFLDIKEKSMPLTDRQLVSVLKKEYHIKVNDMQKMKGEELKGILSRLLNEYSLTIRQLARVTKISATKIWRCNCSA